MAGFDKTLFDEFFGEQPQAIVWLEPILDARGYPVDFHYAWSNEEGFKYLERRDLKDLFVSTANTLNGEMREKILKEIIGVYTTGKRSETVFYNEVLKKHARVLRIKFRNGVLTIIQDITEEHRIINSMQQEKSFSNSILNASLNGIFVASAVRDETNTITDFRFQQINPAFTNLLSLKESDVLGASFLQLFPQSKEVGVFDMHKRVCETGLPESVEVYFPQEKFKAWYHIVSVKFDDGILVTFSDITTQKKALELVERHRTMLANIMEHSPAGISVTEVIRDKNGEVIDGRTIISNDFASHFIGVPKDYYLSKTINEIDPNILKSPLHQQALHTLKTGEPFHTQYFFEPAQRWLELSVSKMDEDRLINIFMDITSLKESQLQLERSLSDLKRSNENLEEFAYAASHDLKEPIRKVLMFTDILKKQFEQKSEEEKRILEKIGKATQRMHVLVEDLLLYSRVTREENLEEDVNLNAKLQLVLEDLELLIKEKNAIIEADSLPTIKGHRRQLQQLFTNLISNSLNYSRENETPHIRISCSIVSGSDTGVPLTTDELHHNFYKITIEDNGIGFEQKDADKIFNVFTRLHGNQTGGTGVGLTIVRKVVENHNGYIRAESSPGHGATFYVYLPKES